MIQDVEELRSQLQVESLRNLRKRNVLEQGEVQVNQPGADKLISPGVPEEICAIDQPGGGCRGSSKSVGIT